MNRLRYAALCAEQALALGAPLGPALEEALTPHGGPSSRERTAIAEARAGRLGPALAALGVDGLVAACARLRPEQASAVSARLAPLPAQEDLARRLAAPLWYMAPLLLVQLGVLVILARFVVPVLQKIALDYQASAAQLSLLSGLGRWLANPFVLPLWVGGLVGLRFLARPLLRRLSRSLFWQLDAARVCAAASVLVQAGARPEDTLPALCEAAGLRPEACAALTGVPLDGPGLSRLADALAVKAEARTARAAEAIRVGVALLGVGLALLILLPVYAALPALAPRLLEGTP